MQVGRRAQSFQFAVYLFRVKSKEVLSSVYLNGGRAVPHISNDVTPARSDSANYSPSFSITHQNSTPIGPCELMTSVGLLQPRAGVV